MVPVKDFSMANATTAEGVCPIVGTPHARLGLLPNGCKVLIRNCIPPLFYEIELEKSSRSKPGGLRD